MQRYFAVKNNQSSISNIVVIAETLDEAVDKATAYLGQYGLFIESYDRQTGEGKGSFVALRVYGKDYKLKRKFWIRELSLINGVLDMYRIDQA